MSSSTFDMLPEQSQVVSMQPLCVKGSVKDAIHACNPIAPYERKYSQRAKALSLKKMGVIGSHVLQVRIQTFSFSFCFCRACGNA